MRWRGSVSANWTKDAFSVGWQSRYFGRYALNVGRTKVLAQGSAYVASQLYHDVNVSYRLDTGLTIRLNINNLFNKKPPLDASAAPLFYSAYGDPRLRTFLVGVAKTF